MSDEKQTATLVDQLLTNLEKRFVLEPLEMSLSLLDEPGAQD